MDPQKTERGFVIVMHPEYPSGKSRRLLQESSAVGAYEDSIDNPGSSYLWVGESHHLCRGEVAELIKRMQHWLDFKRLAVPIALAMLATRAFAQQPTSNYWIRGPITQRSTDTLRWTIYNDWSHRAALHENQSRAAVQDWNRNRRYELWKQHIEDILLHKSLAAEESRARGIKPLSIRVHREQPASHFDADLAAKQARYDAAVDFFRRRSAKASTRFVMDDSERWKAIAARVVK